MVRFWWESYRSKDHMQWHRNIEIKCVIVAYASYEKHNDQNGVAFVTDAKWFCAEFRCKNQSFQSDEGKLSKCHQIAGSRIHSFAQIKYEDCRNIFKVFNSTYWFLTGYLFTYLTIYSRMTTFEQHPMNVPRIASATFILKFWKCLKLLELDCLFSDLIHLRE